MKKILTVIAITLAMLVCMCACRGATAAPEEPAEAPEKSAAADTADAFFAALKAQDYEALADVYAGGELDLLDTAAAADDAEEMIKGTGLDTVYEEQLKPKVLDFDYEIIDEQTDGDKATVNVRIRTYAMGDTFRNSFSDFIAEGAILALNNASREEITARAAEVLTEKLAELTEKDYEKTAALSLTMTGDKWMVDEISYDDDIVDALSGGLVTAVKDAAGSVPEWLINQ